MKESINNETIKNNYGDIDALLEAVFEAATILFYNRPEEKAA